MSKKRKVLHRGLALMLAVVMSLGTCLTAFASESDSNSDTKVTIADGETPYISFGADLRADEKAKVLDYFGLTEADLEKVQCKYSHKRRRTSVSGCLCDQ